MVAVKKGYVDVPEGQIHYYYQAGNGTPIVCLHQTASSGKMFLKVMELLEGKHEFYAFDTPGFGQSFDPEGMPSMKDYGRWLGEAIKAAGLKKFHLLGHHTGACIAAEICNNHPDMIASCMMIGPVPLTKEEREEFRKHFSTPFSPDDEGAYLKATWDYLAGLGADSSLDLHHREFVDTCRAYMGRFQAYSSVWDQDFTSLFMTIKAPLLLMCAPDDVLIDFFDRSREMHPDADAVLLKGANFEPDQDPEGTASAINGFVQKLEKVSS
jgi:pimeloyl-ACP methyl ester carboxylesterase